jgi:glycerol kinase
MAFGYWDGPEDLKRNWGVDKRWEPKMDATRREKMFASWQKVADRSLDWVGS